MQVTTKEFNAIVNAMGYFMQKGDRFWRTVSDEEYERIVAGFEALKTITARHEADNAKTARYIAERRKTDKNYARSRRTEE